MTFTVWRLPIVQGYVAFEFALINVALPSTGIVIGSTEHSVELVLAMYAAGVGAGLLVAGRLADVFGHRRVLIVGLVGQIVSTAAVLAVPFPIIVMLRATHGLASAAALSSAYAMLTSVVSGRERALRRWGTATSVGFGMGTLAGGLISQIGNWRSVFVLLVGTIVVALFAVAPISGSAPRPRAAVDVSIPDLWGSGFAILLLFTALLALNELGGRSPDFLLVAVLAIVSVASLAGFVSRQRVSSEPVVPPGLLRRKPIWQSNVLMAAAAIAAGSMVFFAATFSADVLRWSGIWIGVVLLPQAVAATAGAEVSGRLAEKGVERKKIVLTGFTTIMTGMTMLTFTPATSGQGLAAVWIIVGSSGVGFGLLMLTVTSTIQSSSGSQVGEYGVVGGILNSTQQVSLALGLLLLISIGSAAGRLLWDGSREAEVRLALLVGAVVALSGILMIVIPAGARGVLNRSR